MVLRNHVSNLHDIITHSENQEVGIIMPNCHGMRKVNYRELREYEDNECDDPRKYCSTIKVTKKQKIYI